MLVSGFPLTCPGAALEPHQGFISGAPYGSYVQLLACSISQTVNCFYLLADFCRTLIVPPLYPNSFSPPFIQLFRHPRFYFISAFLFLLKIFFCFMHPSDVDWSARNGRQNSLCHFLRPRCHGAHIRSGRCSWRRKKQILHRGKTKGTA